MVVQSRQRERSKEMDKDGFVIPTDFRERFAVGRELNIAYAMFSDVKFTVKILELKELTDDYRKKADIGIFPDDSLSSIFKSLYEDKKKTLEHVYNETLQGRKVDKKDPLTLKSLMLFLKMAVDILGLDTNLLNKSSSGCRLFQKLIYNYILTTIAQNILSAMDTAFDGIKSSKKFKQDPFCLLAYLETHGTKDP
uniref:Uncharacterized protein n=1 Tax=Chromera velia CCMP2878 TaxID=1169474 RepID=A0A0K6SB28_9ALVE|eukprot:Cvel_12538.t2-p1 / transcript=Cvel_12538.t2 / gene=Cvel_12538 / organism=Chromera_velia_CCMP2878 / gene_product=hypothetical protein / transcript_product=hypothetical protein / location=Cvel_scaffold824:4691-6812(+) / protein_length=194 / sequence_SO=supercontig / SO=protein_coding / is_pseudo=false